MPRLTLLPRRSLPRPFGAAALVLALSWSLASCALFQKPSADAGGAAGVSEGAQTLTVVEDVDHALTQEIGELLLALRSEDAQVALAAEARAEILALDLDAGILALTQMRSARAGAIARERARLPDSFEGSRGAREGSGSDSWGGATLARWSSAILSWELLRRIDTAALEDTGCVPPEAAQVSADARNRSARALPPWHEAALGVEGGAAVEAAASSTAAGEGEGSGDGAYENEAVSASGFFDREQTLPAADWASYGACVLERAAQAWEAADARLSPTLRAAFGEVGASAKTWLTQRSLPVDDHLILGARDVSLRGAAVWTSLPAGDEPVVANGVIVAIRSTGVSVTLRPSQSGRAALGDVSGGRCAWPGERVVAFEGLTQSLSASSWAAGLERLNAAILVCEQEAASLTRDGARVLIDAGVRWQRIQPVLRRMVALKRAPLALAYASRGGALSTLPVELVADQRGDACGVEARLRADGVVLRGGGASTTLLSWAQSDAFEKITQAGQELSARCGEEGVARVYVDDSQVDWGLIVRTMERLSWPQVCEKGPCLQTRLIVGTEP